MDFFEEVISILIDLFIPPMNYVIGISAFVAGLTLTINSVRISYHIGGFILLAIGIVMTSPK